MTQGLAYHISSHGTVEPHSGKYHLSGRFEPWNQEGHLLDFDLPGVAWYQDAEDAYLNAIDQAKVNQQRAMAAFVKATALVQQLEREARELAIE